MKTSIKTMLKTIIYTLHFYCEIHFIVKLQLHVSICSSAMTKPVMWLDHTWLQRSSPVKRPETARHYRQQKATDFHQLKWSSKKLHIYNALHRCFVF